jgi:FAD/FMN-containing dehydrogenase/Fe-S oxidoreductase
MNHQWQEQLATHLDGDVRFDPLHRLLYAQDASVYQEEPLGVVFPKSREDLQEIVRLADRFGFSLIPRAAGTSLAGQCVGPGLIVDTGRYMNRILELNVEERWVRVEPGVILDDLNRFLAPHGLFFGPDTSTSNRCMIGGMIGNNSCGSHSILYGNTMAHVLELGLVFSDGIYERVGPWSQAELREKMSRGDRLGEALRTLDRMVREHGTLIEERYPRPEVLRRNTGYPLDDLLHRAPYQPDGQPFSLARFVCGTEGTLAFTAEAKLNLVDRPRKKILVCSHFNSLEEALRATVEAVKHEPAAVELIDKRTLDQTATNIEQSRNRFFIEGDPAAILVVEFFRNDDEALDAAASKLIASFDALKFGYAHPILKPPKDKAVWELRKAGLGVLMGIAGDVKPVTVVEDTAVAVDVLPEYIHDFSQIMDAYGTACVYYAHASVGELHLRPELNLKEPEDVRRFKGIAEDVADLVRRYRGALSGEHGDGRVRSPLLERFYGADVMELHRSVKTAFDPRGVFNPGNIVDPRPIDADFRFEPGLDVPQVQTYFNWESDLGLVRATEKCNGAGACRKRAEAGGTMCPSYMATLEEKDSTRGRANVFRTLLTRSDAPEEAFTSDELYEALDLCISCKGCKSECPANVDMARMKAEFLQQRYDRKGTPWSARMFGQYARLSRLASLLPALANFMASFVLTRWLMKALFNISPARTLPAYARRRFAHQYRDYRKKEQGPSDPVSTVWLYVDPFTEYTEPEIAMAAVKVLEAAKIKVEILPIADDGRTQISKGLVREAKAMANGLVPLVSELIEAHPERKVVGLEPSALLTFRDEFPDLVDPNHRGVALRFSERCRLFEEYVDEMMQAGLWQLDFSQASQPLVLHGHCHQKAIVGVGATERVLSAAGYKVSTLATGCCGMAGSFGYEDNHYELSMAIGELVLFPAVRSASPEAALCAPGTSCRHQISDGTGRRAEHPAVLLARRLD